MLALRVALWIGLIAAALCPPHCPAQERKQAGSKTEKFVTVYGAKIHYVETGNGAPLILIHGLADNVEIWDSVIPPLSAKLRVIAFDQIGFGQSDKPLLNYRVSTFVDFLDGFMKELKIERASLVGNSLGGWIATAFALAHPERVDRLVLCDAAGYRALAQAMEPRTLDALKLASRDDIRYWDLSPFTINSFTKAPRSMTHSGKELSQAMATQSAGSSIHSFVATTRWTTDCTRSIDRHLSCGAATISSFRSASASAFIKRSRVLNFESSTTVATCPRSNAPMNSPPPCFNF